MSAPPPPQPSVIIADDHPLFRQGLSYCLSSLYNIHVAAQAHNGEELCAYVQQYSPQVVITDIAMPVMDGIEATRWIKSAYPKTGVIALSMSEDASLVKEMLEAGAGTYLLKNEEVTAVRDAVYAVSRGGYFVSTTMRGYFSQRIVPKDSSSPLTKREAEILQLIYEELNSREISERLFLSQRTIEDHRKHIQQKTNTKNIAGLIKYVIKKGWFKT